MEKYESYQTDWESSEGPPNFDMEDHIRDTWTWFENVLKSPKVRNTDKLEIYSLSLLLHQWLMHQNFRGES